MIHQKLTITMRLLAAAIVMLAYSGMAQAQCTGSTITWTNAQLQNFIWGGWLAKCAGGALGGPAEGSGTDTSRGLPALTEGDITNCNNDDVYVQVPFVAVMATTKTGANGIYSATMQDYATAFKNTSFQIWCGNNATRNALNAGIAAPYCGGWPQPPNNVVRTGNGCGGTPACEDIDWSIECQWIGLATPFLPQTCIKIDSTCGHVIAYANGIYAGRFFDVAMSIAPCYTDIHALLKAARYAIPKACTIRKNIDTLVWYHDNNPTKTYVDAMNWAFGTGGQAKHTVTDYNVGSLNNTTIVVIAALWCENSITAAVLWAVRMGQDTDCNCGDVAGILGAMLGYSSLPQQWQTTYNNARTHNNDCQFSGTGLSGWGFSRVLDSTISIAKKAILQSGGSYNAGTGTYTIPVQSILTPTLIEVYGQQPASTGLTSVLPLSLPGSGLEIGKAFSDNSSAPVRIYSITGQFIGTMNGSFLTHLSPGIYLKKPQGDDRLLKTAIGK
jgi:hypothetical protein